MTFGVYLTAGTPARSLGHARESAAVQRLPRCPSMTWQGHRNRDSRLTATISAESR